ncbi:hypothetical protein F5X68DRAFT_2187 [Plectosphaerella plurivora]|uniref:Uncharacterized protein n=1 Tax=Plectosphaerella plurivora TaxID=936078 RepID=A0A9P8VMX4_9PEZI|nr:hypothetical protein F5X68DRAFT_2187 [Plectosphaerella plurivora]
MPLLSSRKAHTTTAPRSSGGLFSRRRQPVTSTHRSHGLTGPKTTTHKRSHGLTGNTTTTTTTTTTRKRGGLFSRRAAPRTQQRKPTMGDKISGAMLKLKGSLTRRPGQKAAGTRRMHGTDGRGQRRTRY